MRYYPSSSGGDVTTIGGKNVRTTRFVSIGAGTSGTASLPSNSTVVLDDFGGTVDAVVLQISGGKPLKAPALTALGSVVAATFDAGGNWTFNAAPATYPVALVYRVQQTELNFSSTDADIWGDAEAFGAQNGIIAFNIDGGGDVPNTGLQGGSVVIPFDCVITSATLLADQAGSCVVDIWKKAYASFPPSIADTIVASAPPTLTAAQKSQDTTLTGWSKSLSSGDVLFFNLNSVATLTHVTLALGVART